MLRWHFRYKAAKALWTANTTKKESWSDLYTFASGQGVGLTAMRTMDNSNTVGNGNASMIGVLAVDYSLGTVRQWLQARFGVGTEDENSTAVYLVELESSMLLGWSPKDEYICAGTQPSRIRCVRI